MAQLWLDVKKWVFGRFWWSIRHSKGNVLNIMSIWKKCDFGHFWPLVGPKTHKYDFASPNTGHIQNASTFWGGKVGKFGKLENMPNNLLHKSVRGHLRLWASDSSDLTSKWPKIAFLVIWGILAQNAFSEVKVRLPRGSKMAKIAYPPNTHKILIISFPMPYRSLKSA